MKHNSLVRFDRKDNINICFLKVNNVQQTITLTFEVVKQVICTTQCSLVYHLCLKKTTSTFDRKDFNRTIQSVQPNMLAIVMAISIEHSQTQNKFAEDMGISKALPYINTNFADPPSKMNKSSKQKYITWINMSKWHKCLPCILT